MKATQEKKAEYIKCSHGTVQNMLNNYVFKAFQGHHKCREYQWITTKCEDRYIKYALMQNNTLPSHDIINILPVKISETTLWWQQSEVSLGSYIIAEKPGLHPENIEAQLQ